MIRNGLKYIFDIKSKSRPLFSVDLYKKVILTQSTFEVTQETFKATWEECILGPSHCYCHMCCEWTFGKHFISGHL